MVNYQDGKIYKLESNQTDAIYIGSTAEKYLSRRLQKHKANYKILKDVKCCTAFQILKYDDCVITLIENYPCDNVYELRQREAYYIKNMKCVNKNSPVKTDDVVTCSCLKSMLKTNYYSHIKTGSHENELKKVMFDNLLNIDVDIFA